MEFGTPEDLVATPSDLQRGSDEDSGSETGVRGTSPSGSSVQTSEDPTSGETLTAGIREVGHRT